MEPHKRRVAALLLLIAQHVADAAFSTAVAIVTFFLLLAPVFIPVAMKAYDGIFVNIVLNCCRKKFDFTNSLALFLVFLTSIPGTVARFFGGGGGDAGGEEAGDEGQTGVAIVSKMAVTCRTLIVDSLKIRQASRLNLRQRSQQRMSRWAPSSASSTRATVSNRDAGGHADFDGGDHAD